MFEKFLKVSSNEFGTYLLYSMSLLSYTWQYGRKKTDIKIQIHQDKESILSIENTFQGGISLVMGARSTKSHINKKMLLIDALKFNGYAMSESLPSDQLNFERNVTLNDILNTSDDSDIGYFVEVDLKNPRNMTKTMNFPFSLEKKKNISKIFTPYMKENKPITYKQNRTFISD